MKRREKKSGVVRVADDQVYLCIIIYKHCSRCIPKEEKEDQQEEKKAGEGRGMNEVILEEGGGGGRGGGGREK